MKRFFYLFMLTAYISFMAISCGSTKTECTDAEHDHTEAANEHGEHLNEDGNQHEHEVQEEFVVGDSTETHSE